MADLDAYLSLFTAQHRDKPRYMAVAQTLLQGPVALQNALLDLPRQFDLDVAIGAQLDVVGEWVGASRGVDTPIEGVYFAFDTEDVGFDEGVWKGPFDPDAGVSRLDDDTFRQLIRAKIGANHWDGTVESATPVFNAIFDGETYAFIQDNQDMSMDIALAGKRPSALFKALLTRGYLPIKPAGVRVNYYILPTYDGPLFGFDMDNQYVAGFDKGAWGLLYGN